MKNPAVFAAAVSLGAWLAPAPCHAQLFTVPKDQMIELTIHHRVDLRVLVSFGQPENLQ